MIYYQIQKEINKFFELDLNVCINQKVDGFNHFNFIQWIVVPSNILIIIIHKLEKKNTWLINKTKSVVPVI